MVEGLDGSGKNTLVTALVARLTAAGRRVATLDFPRYGRSVHADLVRDMLYGRLGDLSGSVHGGALLFALDRLGARDELTAAIAAHDVVLLDRYVSANAAYAAARLGAPDDAEQTEAVPRWVRELEIDRFALPVPDHQLLLATGVAESARRAAHRAAADDTRALDAFERDAALQHRTGRMYALLAEQGYLSPWTVLDGDDGPAGVPDAVLLG